jgi:hypothetical protein
LNLENMNERRRPQPATPTAARPARPRAETNAPGQPRCPAHRFTRHALRISGCGFPSVFGFRISDFSPTLTAAASLLTVAALACGPDFPNTLLDRGDDALLSAPTANFQLELARMKLAAPACRVANLTNSYTAQTFEAELRDLRAALVRAKVPEDQRAEILAHQATARARLNQLAPGASTPENADEAAAAAPALPRSARDAWPQLAAGLPPEFADYFTASVAWHADLTNQARADWAGQLRRPEAERHFRSTWAAYMLGRSWHAEDPDKAIDYYQQVRALAKEGYADSLGLAAASLGWEAQARFQQKRHAEAIELYLAQLAAGDESAVNSLRFIAAQAVRLNADALESFAANPATRRVLTAYVVSHPGYLREPEPEAQEGDPTPPHPAETVVHRWLAAVEAAQVQDVESAESLALAAYQAGQWDLAQRWINRAHATPTAQWLQVKLLLRAGKTQPAGALLAQVARQFPLAPEGADRPAPTGLKDTLSLDGHSYLAWHIEAPSQVLGEMGVVLLARREYAQALDALLRAGFWLDAAYVAERVLTTDELKSYVDIHWPVVETEPAAKAQSEADSEAYKSGFDPGTEIRYLLARRLARVERPSEARAYYPPQWQGRFDQWQAQLQQGADASRPAVERGRALFAAAWLTRTNGLELIGTEVEPDWKVHGGDFQEGVSLRTRTQNLVTNELDKSEGQPEGVAPTPSQVQILTNQIHASPAELERARAHALAPEIRWHYRDRAGLLGLQAARLLSADFHEMARVIQTAHLWTQDSDVVAAFYKEAAALGWQAAQALPDNSDETARVLCIAGSWLKYHDPKAADRFYKALVRRCRQTALGELADRKRWFPILDEQGNPLPWKPNPPTEMPPPDTDAGDADALAAALANGAPPAAGYGYVLHRGNSLQDVADAVLARHHVRVTVAELLEANPGADPTRLKVGQKVFVPASIGVPEPPGLPEDRADPAPATPPDSPPVSN